MARQINDNEKSLILFLVKDIKDFRIDLEQIKVEEMNDGGMGSIYFINNEIPKDQRKMGRCISESQFMDSDSIPILVALNVDQNESLYELDIWKVDFSPLITFPKC